MEEILARSGGTTFEEISKSSFRPIPVLVPNTPLLNAFTALTNPLHRRMVESLHESALLAALRDGLLPGLLSGEIHVSEAQKVLERASA
jgi:type I restriction enzyme S subunit